MRLRQHEAIQPGSGDMYRADPRLLTIQENYNVRDLSTPDAVNKLEELANSIVEIGVTDPLVVRFDGERIIVVEGHRRLAATLMAIERGAEIKSVPIYQEARGANDAQRDLGLIISNSGEPLTPLEKAKVVGRLVAHGWSQQEIAKRCGWKSVGSVNQYLDMLAMPEKVKDHVRQGTISATTARNLAKSDLTPEQQDELIRKNKEENKRLSGGKRRNTSTKVTRGTLKRDAKPKSESATADAARRELTNGTDHSALSASSAQIETVAPEIEERVSVSETDGSGVSEVILKDHRGFVAGYRIRPDGGGYEVALQSDTFKVPDTSHVGALMAAAIQALAIFAKHAEESCVNERPDDYVVEIPASDLKRAWEAYQAVSGDV